MFVEATVGGQRKQDIKRNENIGYGHINLNTPALMELHTGSLLKLLKLLREEILACARSSSSDYELITRKSIIVENILLYDRMGYIPKTINDKLIHAFEERCKDPYNQRLMIIENPTVLKNKLRMV